jgi:phospholipid/cholesterol/gamma-HCH transport system ATP-binding protein
MIRLEGVTKRFGDVEVLSDISLEVPAGGTLALVGEGGAGKSLILKLICGLIEPDAGTVHVDGQPMHALPETERMGIRGRIGMIFQNYALFDYLTVADNIGFPLAQTGRFKPAEIARRVQRRLDQVHLPDIGPRMPGQLSGGMKKRVCLARATVHDPPIMLCDDPTAGLDPVTTNRIFRLLKALQAENAATVIIVSHEVEYLKPICDRFAMLDRGRLIFDGTVDEVPDAPEAVRRFMTGEGIA